MAEVRLGAGDLRERIAFQSRGVADDGFGNSVALGAFETAFAVWANLTPLRGSEPVVAARLAGQQPYVLTVRRSSDTLRVTTNWQVVDARDTSRVFAITAPPHDPDDRRTWLEMIVVEGRSS